MDTIDENRKKAMIARAERMIFYNDKIIEICDNWLPAEQANANMFREIEERRKKEKEAQEKQKKQEKQAKWTSWMKWGKSSIKNEKLRIKR